MFEDPFELSDEMDHEILMHRNAHFGGSFSAMIDYYEKDGKGSDPEIELHRIYQLMHLEQTQPDCFENFLLSDEEEKVTHAKKLYQKFQNLHDNPKAPALGLAIADLILTEEEEPSREIDQVVSFESQAVQPLIDLLLSEDFYSPLSPGYGFAPAFAAQVLGKLGNPKAIIPLFQALGRHDFFLEAVIIEALTNIGQPAKEFLLKRLSQEPLNMDNTHAAIALVPFREDDEVAKAALDLLEKVAHLDAQKVLSSYLILVAGGLKQPQDKQRLVSLSLNQEIPLDVKSDLREVVKPWIS